VRYLARSTSLRFTAESDPKTTYAKYVEKTDSPPPPQKNNTHTTRYAFVLASNRDEYFTRPTRRAHLWEREQEQEKGEVVLAGKDLLGGGTWLGVTQSGRVSVLTNYRTPGDDDASAAAAAAGKEEDDGNGGSGGGGSKGGSGPAAGVGNGKKRSRGRLVLDYLHNRGGQDGGPRAYAERVVAEVGVCMHV
jgi:hypothetical protein